METTRDKLAPARGQLLNYRLLSPLLLGTVVALSLAWFMNLLIESGDRRLDTEKRAHLADFVRVKRNESTRTKQRVPERPVFEKMPDMPDLGQTDNSATDSIAVTQMDISVGHDIDLSAGLEFGSSDGEYLPIVKVAPVYPVRALSRKVEGTCLVEYTVTPTGQTKDIMVVESHCPEEMFRTPSVKAAQKFRYKPRVIDGVAIEVPGIQNMFHFIMEENYEG